MKTIKLNDQTNIPVLGFGTWRLQGNECQKSVEKALEIGYRHIDTADAYDNHQDVAKAIQSSMLKREELFVTTKVWRDSLAHDDVIDGAKRFLDELKIDYIDLLLVHWPNRDVPVEETLAAMEELKKSKLIKTFGVSNFTIHHLQDALHAGYKLSCNQVEFHPSLNQKELKKFCHENGIVITCYSTNAFGADLKIPEIVDIAQKYNKLPYQVILNWIISNNMVAIPRSSNAEHIQSNFESLSFELSLEDIEKINNLGGNNRVVNPSFAEFGY